VTGGRIRVTFLPAGRMGFEDLLRLPWPIREARLARLASRAGGGDRAAVVALYRALQPDVARFVGRRVAARADAEDAVSATFHRLLESLGRLDGTKGSVTGYALAVARSVLADGTRRRLEAFRLEDAPEPEDPRADTLGRILRSEDEALLRRHLAALPAGTRELLALRYADGLRWAEVAALLDEPEEALRQRCSRAVRDLREALRDPAGGELAHE
jgi:RNA polymerase sigma-70 factor (ECF subfamily)